MPAKISYNDTNFNTPALLLARPELDGSPRRGDDAAAPASLAVILLCLTVVSLVLGAYHLGRVTEQRSQLGYLLAAAPALEDLTAATRSADSLGMQMMLRLGRLRAKR